MVVRSSNQMFIALSSILNANSHCIGQSTLKIRYLGAKLTEEQESKKDLEKARISIDTTRMLVETLLPLVSKEEAKQLNEVVSNLQFAYVKEAD